MVAQTVRLEAPAELLESAGPPIQVLPRVFAQAKATYTRLPVSDGAYEILAFIALENALADRTAW